MFRITFYIRFSLKAFHFVYYDFFPNCIYNIQYTHVQSINFDKKKKKKIKMITLCTRLLHQII